MEMVEVNFFVVGVWIEFSEVTDVLVLLVVVEIS